MYPKANVPAFTNPINRREIMKIQEAGKFWLEYWTEWGQNRMGTGELSLDTQN